MNSIFNDRLILAKEKESRPMFDQSLGKFRSIFLKEYNLMI